MYGLLTAGVITLSLVRSAVFFWATMVASTRMHNGMLLRVLRAPLAFFHTNPAGRVLNRFSNDQVGGRARPRAHALCMLAALAAHACRLARMHQP